MVDVIFASVLQIHQKSFSIAPAESLFIQNISLIPMSIYLFNFWQILIFNRCLCEKNSKFVAVLFYERLNKFLTSPKVNTRIYECILIFHFIIINLVSKYASDTFWRAITWFTLCTLQFFFVFHFFPFHNHFVVVFFSFFDGTRWSSDSLHWRYLILVCC